jgi:hypothetical protein
MAYAKTALALFFGKRFFGRAEAISQIVWQKQLILESEPFPCTKVPEPEPKLMKLLIMASSS